CYRDWSSDVCSSDLSPIRAGKRAAPRIGDEIVEQDENPAQPEQRIISREPPAEPGVGAAVDLLGRRAKALLQLSRQVGSRVEHRAEERRVGKEVGRR